MIGTISTMIAAASMAATMATTPIAESDLTQWESIGEQRITTYCPVCNDGAGHESSTGKYLEYGDCACSWLPVGTVINIEGEEFTVVDTCGTDAIDIFIDDDSGECRCDRNEYKKVSVWR